MADRIRGLEVSVRVTAENQLRYALFRHVTEYEITPRQDLPESQLIGKSEAELDFLHDGWDLSWGTHIEDGTGIDFIDRLVDLQVNNQPHPLITVTFEYRFRHPAIRNKNVVYRKCKLKLASEGAGSRSDYHMARYEAKCGRRRTITL